MANKRRSPSNAHPNSSEPLLTRSTEASQDPDTVWQSAHDALQAAFDAGNQIFSLLHDPGQINLLISILDVLSQELTALNQEGMESRTLSLQAAAQQLGGGIAHLNVLKQQLAQIASTIAEAAKVVNTINDAISGISAFLATFPAV